MKNFDVAIIGGGIIGASAACELAGEKLRVIVLDRQQPGREASWAAAGMLSPSPHKSADAVYTPLGNESLRLYPAFVAAFEEESRVATNFSRCGAMEIFFGERAEHDCNRAVTENRRLGVNCESISTTDARKLESSFSSLARAAMWLPDEASVEPRLLFQALLGSAAKRGVTVRSNSKVTGLLLDGNRCKGVIVGEETIFAKHVVVASGCFCGTISNGTTDNDIFARYAPTHPVRGQLLALRPADLLIRRPMRSHNGYLVPRQDGRIVAGSTLEDVGFDNHVTAEGIREILEGACELMPELSSAEIVETWSGLRPGTPDGLPILGPTHIEGLLIATGHYRNGILLAPITARLIGEWIMRGLTTFNAEAFSPLRFSQQKPQSNYSAKAPATS